MDFEDHDSMRHDEIVYCTLNLSCEVGTVEKLLKAFRDKKVELETTEAKAVSDFERGRPRVSRAFHDFFSSLTRNDQHILNDCDTWQ